jgi:hypothetical protein
LKWITSTALRQAGLSIVEKSTPLAQFILDADWEKPDADMQRLIQFSEIILDPDI